MSTKTTIIHDVRTINGFDIDFEITTTLYGEVLSVHCPFLKLPTAAQRLMVGSDCESISGMAKGYANIFTYALPLVFLDYLNTDEWKNIKRQLDAFKEKHLVTIPPPASQLQQDWVKQVYALYGSGDTRRHLTQAAKLLTKESEKRYAALKDYLESVDIDYYDPLFFGPIFLGLLPISHNISTLRAIYRALATYPTNEVYILLSSRLTNPLFNKYHHAILQGLQSYNQPDYPQTLMAFYNNNPLLTGKLLLLFIENVEKLPPSRREEVLFQILISDNRQAAIIAYERLKRTGTAASDIAARLYKIFKERRSLENMRSILKLYGLFTDAIHLPDASELLDTMKWANTQKQAIAINYAITPLLKNKIDNASFLKLVDLLNHDNIHIQKASIEQVRALAQPKHLPIIDKSISKKNKELQPQLLYLSKKLLESYATKEPIEPLLQFLTQTETQKSEALIALKRSLRHKASSKAIDPLIQVLQQESNPKIRKKTLITLRIFKDKKVKQAIQQIAATDKDPTVIKTAQECLNWIANPLPETIKRERERKKKIEAFLEALIKNNEAENGRPLPSIARLAIKIVGRAYYSHFPRKEWEE